LPRRPTLSNPHFTRKLLDWYDRHRRDLPWRRPTNRSKEPLDPYAVLVSEFMLQQTQVSTVIPYFHAFMNHFPTLASLAKGSEQEVLRLWQGLGYYSRARNLRATAQQILANHSGQLPNCVETLRTLPGIGRYTAGAIASLAFDTSAPILDGNVARVLCRVKAIRQDPRTPAIQKRLWKLAEEILPTHRPGDFNSALMELGATICTPRTPNCSDCPVNKFCRAAQLGLTNHIPRPRTPKPTPVVTRWTICIKNKSHWLIEQRPIPGRWAGLWQFITLEPPSKHVSPQIISKQLSIPITDVKPLAQIRHALTHRRYIFEVFTARAKSRPKSANRRWITLSELSRYPLPKPHETVARLLQSHNGSREY
jgi:A/G-specific adenine glycosylase